jgi:hypothetical protein
MNTKSEFHREVKEMIRDSIPKPDEEKYYTASGRLVKIIAVAIPYFLDALLDIRDELDEKKGGF